MQIDTYGSEIFVKRKKEKKKKKERNPTVKPREPLNNKCNEFLWTSRKKKDFGSLQNYVSQGLEWAFHSWSNLPLVIYFDAP